VVVVRRGLLGMEETAQRKCTCLPMFRTRWVEELAPAVPTEEPLELNRLAPGLIQALVEQALTAAAMEGSPEVAIMAGTAPNLTLPNGSGGGGAGGPAEFGGLASAGNGGSYGGGGGGLGTTQNGSARFSSAGEGIIVIVYDALTVNPATVAELWFSSTPGFVDFTVQSNRRNFISAAGGAQNLGASGQNPFGITPPVFLSSNGTPSTFAANNGRGGAFTNLAHSWSTAPQTRRRHPLPWSRPHLHPWPRRPWRLSDRQSVCVNEATYTDNGTPRKWMRRWRAVPPDTFNAVNTHISRLTWKPGGCAEWSEPASGPAVE